MSFRLIPDVALHYPDKALAALPVRPSLVWALDNHPARTGATRRRHRHRGALLLADSAEKKGVIVWAKTGATAFPLEFAEQTHWRSLADKRFEAALDSGPPPPPRPASRASPTAPSISRTTSKTP